MSRQTKERLYCTLHQAGECPALSQVCYKCNKQGHYAKLCCSRIQSTTSALTSNRNTRGSWRGRGRGHGSKCAVYKAETSDTSKPIIDATNSEVDIIKLLQAYGMVPTEGSEHRRKKVATDEYYVFQNLDSDFTVDLKPMVLHGSLVECNIDVQWETGDAILPMSTYITDHVVAIEVGKPLDWSFDVHLIEVHDVHTELNGSVLKAKQDTGAQMNMLSKTVFQTLQKECKLPLYPKTCVKLTGWK